MALPAPRSKPRSPHDSHPRLFNDSDLNELDALACELQWAAPGPWRERIITKTQIHLSDSNDDPMLRFASDAPDELVQLLSRLDPRHLRQLIHEAQLWRRYVHDHVRLKPAEAAPNAV